MRFMMLMIPRVYQGPEGRNIARYNERLARAGALIALDGLHPPANGARVGFKAGKAGVAVGPPPESNGVIGGYWMIRAESLQDAVEWARQCPGGDGDVIEIRQVFYDSEFPEDVRKAAESPAVKAALEQQARTPLL